MNEPKLLLSPIVRCWMKYFRVFVFVQACCLLLVFLLYGSFIFMFMFIFMVHSSVSIPLALTN